MALFTYPDLTRRVITDPSLERFIWVNHNFATKYQEPFSRVQSGNNQGFVVKSEVKPVRYLTLRFPILSIKEPEDTIKSGLNFTPHLDFNALKAFYLRHQSHSNFIYEHPVYGDMVVRFAKPLSMPKKNESSTGTVQGFTLELIEVVTTDYNFMKGEDFSPTLPFPLTAFDVEIEYLDATLNLPLGGNYSMVFKDTKPVLKRLKLSIPTTYYNVRNNKVILSSAGLNNAALLEVFYLHHRLEKTFIFNYLGESITVCFEEPITIPEMIGNTGQTGQLEITLIENPYPMLTL